MTRINGPLRIAMVVSVIGVLFACAEPEDVTTAPDPTQSPAELVQQQETPAVEKRTVVERQPIPFSKKTVKDPTLASGTREVRTRGIAGVRTLTYEVTLTDGAETGKKLVRSKVTKAPVAQVTAIGTKGIEQQPKCDPNYSGCVPVAEDVDCAGGSGNGPAYVSGPVKVTGSDIYRLDSDKDGYGCED